MATAPRWRRMAAAALLCASAPPWTGPVSAADDIEVNLEVVGRSGLDHPGTYGDVAVVGMTAVVATDALPGPGSPCPMSSVKVMDIKDPRQPRVASSVPLPPGMTAADIDATSVDTPAFTGDVVAFALSPRPGPAGPCGDATGASIVYHDITDPAHPRVLSQMAECRSCGTAPHSVSLVQRADGRVLSARVNTARPGVAIDDLTDPVRPKALSLWPDPQPVGGGACSTAGGAVTARLHDDGQGAVAVFQDGRVYDLELADPSVPSAVGEAPAPSVRGLGTHAAVLPLGNRTITIVSEDATADACADAGPGPGLRVLTLGQGAAPREESPVRFPSAASPGRLVASGSLAYVAWHGDGLRVVDFGEIRARTVAQFAPARADVVGVGLLPDHIVVTDATLGLYVLERPDEGKTQSFWSRFGGFLPYLGFAGFASAMFVVPRLTMAWAAARSRAGVPTPVPARRRRA